MDLPNSSATILEQCKVSPPANSVPETTIPLTFFDMPWLFGQVERILFYDFPHPTSYTIEAIIPSLKHSLSLSLQHFFSLAGCLVCPPLPLAPHLLYKDGDSIPFIVAESNDDYSKIVENTPKNAMRFRPLVPMISHETSFSSSDADQVPMKIIRPLIALQVTIFPNVGISIGYTYRHAVGDGRALHNFIKSWASISKSPNDLSLTMQPCHNRSDIIKDPNELSHFIRKQWCEAGVSWEKSGTLTATTTVALQEKIHTTIVLHRGEIEKLRDIISLQFEKMNEIPPLSYISTFVVTSAFLWVCLIKLENELNPMVNGIISLNDELIYHFGFLVDCTERKELSIPKKYFGNCLDFCASSVLKNDLLGEVGLMKAAKAIMKEIKDLENGFLNKVESWIPNSTKLVSSGRLTTVAGSPKLRAYEIDFGWGPPRKSEAIHIDKSARAISLTESREEQGGVEIGLALDKNGMDAFISIFEESLILASSSKLL